MGPDVGVALGSCLKANITLVELILDNKFKQCQ